MIESMFINRRNEAVHLPYKAKKFLRAGWGSLNHYSAQFSIITYLTSKGYNMVVLDSKSNVVEEANEGLLPDAEQMFERLHTKYVLDHDRVLS